MSNSDRHEQIHWKTHGVKVIPGDQLDPNTAQTPGMDRAAAINLARDDFDAVRLPIDVLVIVAIAHRDHLPDAASS